MVSPTSSSSSSNSSSILVAMKAESTFSVSSSSLPDQHLSIIPGMNVITSPNGTLISVDMTQVFEYTATRMSYIEDSNGSTSYPTNIPRPGKKAKYIPDLCDRMDNSPIVITRDNPFDPSESMFDSWRACVGINYENFGFVGMMWERAPARRPLRDLDDDPQPYTNIRVWVDPQDKLSISRIEEDNDLRRREIAWVHAETRRLASRTLGQKILDECIIM